MSALNEAWEFGAAARGPCTDGQGETWASPCSPEPGEAAEAGVKAPQSWLCQRKGALLVAEGQCHSCPRTPS